MRRLSGNTIIEVLIATTLVSVAVLAALKLSSNTQKQTDFSRDLGRATFYNNQGAESLRNIRQSMGFSSFVYELTQDTAGSSLTYCLNTLPTDAASFSALASVVDCGSSVISGTSFQREATLTLSGSPTDKISLTVTTYWDNRARSTQTETIMTQWQ